MQVTHIGTNKIAASDGVMQYLMGEGLIVIYGLMAKNHNDNVSLRYRYGSYSVLKKCFQVRFEVSVTSPRVNICYYILNAYLIHKFNIC
jgi:hypothetical protein